MTPDRYYCRFSPASSQHTSNTHRDTFVTHLRTLDPGRIALGHAVLAAALLTLVVAIADHDEDGGFWVEK